jgi:poly(U)-specific endoribonuclease
MSANEKEETWHFLHVACNTVPMRYAFEWCKANGGPANEVAWKLALFNLWFGTFSRGAGVASSSAFEHVFVGEVKNNEVTGFHNWLQFYYQEKAGHVDYRGYVVPHRRGQPTSKVTGKEPVLSLKFAWAGEVKPVSTFLIGTTPEFELALYTMAFYSKKETIVADFAGFDVDVITHRFNTRDGDKLGSAYFDVKQ